MKQYKALIFRLYPNKIQEDIIHLTLGCTRFIYNHYLSKNQQLYQNENIKLSCFDAIKDLPIRDWECPKCGAEHDRDSNVAINIMF